MNRTAQIEANSRYTIPEACKILSIERHTLYNWEKKKLIHISRRPGRRPRIAGVHLLAALDDDAKTKVK